MHFSREDKIIGRVDKRDVMLDELLYTLIRLVWTLALPRTGNGSCGHSPYRGRETARADTRPTADGKWLVWTLVLLRKGSAEGEKTMA